MSGQRRKVTRKSNPSKRHSSGLVIRDTDLARARPFKWAWDQRVLLGAFNILVGEEGVGKGTLAAWIGARITRGELAGDLRGGRAVAFVGDEDSWDHIWVPRLEAAGVQGSLAEYIDSGSDGVLDVKRHADELRKYIKSKRVALVYFDQLLDNLGYNTDSWNDKKVRDALAPLRKVAQATNAAMLASMHPNKRGGTFRDRISGSAAFNTLARNSLLVAHHPDEPGRRVVVRPKGNYSFEPDAFEFRIEEYSFDLDKPKRTIKTSRIADQRETGLTAADVLDARPSRKDEHSKAGQARALLSELFRDGEKRPATEVLDHLFEHHELDKRVVQSAREELGIDTWAEGFPAVRYWGMNRPKNPPKIQVVRGGKSQ